MSVGLPNILELISRPEDFIMNYPLYRWYKGCIEDIFDPEKRGRVRVRIEEIWDSSPKSDTDTTEQIEMETLPWADFFIHGQGEQQGLFTVPPKGTAVVVGFEKGQEQHPWILGSWWGMSQTDKNKPEIPIAARGGSQTGETGNDKKGNDTGVATAGGGTITEPADPYAAEYPQNTVYRTTSGHLVEFDNTKDKERINIAHKSGTWAEFHPDGSLVFGVQGKRYTVIVGDDAEHVKGKQDVVVDGDATLKSTNYKNDVTADYTQVVSGNTMLTTTVNKTETISGNKTETVTGVNTETVGTHIETVTATSTVTVTGASTHTAAAATLAGLATASVTSPATTVIGTATLALTAPVTTIVVTGGPFFPVVNTGTHPVDYITGIPILGSATVSASS